jgi:N-acetylmuramoyl-L-alanine amidase
MRPIDKLIVHCSDTPSHMDIGVKEIREWHTKDRCFSDVGYHYVIRRNGKLEDGRPIGRIGAHCKGHNLYSVGICVVGRDEFDPRQIVTLDALLESLMETFHLRPGAIYGHYELTDKKTCPNMKMDDVRARITNARET